MGSRAFAAAAVFWRFEGGGRTVDIVDASFLLDEDAGAFESGCGSGEDWVTFLDSSCLIDSAAKASGKSVGESRSEEHVGCFHSYLMNVNIIDISKPVCSLDSHAAIVQRSNKKRLC